MSKTTKKTSFFANLNKKFNLFRNVKKHKLTQFVIEKIKTLKKVHDNILKMQTDFAKYQKKMHFN